MARLRLIICECCDAVYARRDLAPGQTAHCRRCGAELYRNRRVDLDAMLAIALGGLIVLVIANAYPVLIMELGGTRADVTLWDAILATFDAGVGPVAVLAALSLFVLPLTQILLFLYVLLPLRVGAVPAGFVPVMHAIRHLRPWSMVEVFLVGVLVSAVKLAAESQLTPGVGLWGFAALTILLTLLTLFDLQALWDLAAERAAQEAAA
ncbi:paraquat-inducible protein A [Sinimarinibacterium thermocellulolyticum]|uniref:Paraquat-inducible protein A n=1 Tax=Sinimarinibacterium thermocellulolyticum TaxID=3170016 RepID=A0ABV2A835_9GAMM